MVQKIQIGEYLKRYDNMSAEERHEYTDRVGQWLRSEGRLLAARTTDPAARLQNVLTAGVGWNDAERKAFEEGVRLLSALVRVTDTRLPDLLYAISAKRAIRHLIATLASVRSSSTNTQDTPAVRRPEEKPAKTAASAQKAADKPKADSAAKSAYSKPVTVSREPSNSGVEPARPKHIDQYVHLLPKKTQEHAAQVKDLLRDLDTAREKMRLLVEDPTAKADDRAAWARRATSIDNKVRSIYDELDAEWTKLVKEGRVVVDDLGNARVIHDSENAAGMQGGVCSTELTSEQKARRRELRKWLIDLRRGNGNAREARVEKWRENFSEYLTLEGSGAFEDMKIVEAAKHYDIDLNEYKEGRR